MAIRAIIFDFDGLILETESPVHQSWAELYQEYGLQLSMELWAKVIGTAEGTFNPLDDLEKLLGKPLDKDALAVRRRQREDELVLAQEVMPGVPEYLQEARRLGLKIGLASSSSCNWVLGHLQRLGLLEYFEVIRASDDVQYTKPDPALYLAALVGLGVSPDQAFALEDSPNGITAARQAGLFCVAVPNRMTRDLPIHHADLVLESLAEIPLEHLVDVIEHHKQSNPPVGNALIN